MKTLFFSFLSLFLCLGVYETQANPVQPTRLSASSELADPESLARMAKRLCGTWEHSYLAPEIFVAEGLCANIEQARLSSFQYAFRPDGTFSKGLYCRALATNLTAEGRWSISADGKALTLECFDEETPYVEVLTIRHVDADELIVEQPLRFHRMRAEAPHSEMYFNKI